MSIAPASPASRPPGIRTYATLVVALAAFLASMVVLRVPFRGYLVEARLSGRLGDGLDKAAIESWLKAAAPGVNVRVDAASSGRCEVNLQHIALRAGEAQAAIDRVARQFAEHYVAERREATRQVKLARLQGELQTARDTEDAVRARLDELRQSQSPQNIAALSPEVLPAPGSPQMETLAMPGPGTPLPASDAGLASLRERIEQLRAELAGLLGNCTEAHPKVITLRAQIAGLEHELATPVLQTGTPNSGSGVFGGQPLAHPDRLDSAKDRGPPDHPSAKWVIVCRGGTMTYEPANPATENIDAALANLAAATRARQWAERQLQTEVETLAAAPGFPWSVEPARVLARVGGTPRTLTLVGATLIALLAALVAYLASATLVPRVLIQSTDELADSLALPLVGTMRVAGRPHHKHRRIAPWLVQTSVHSAEIVLAAMFLALAFTMLSDRWLASQIIADPFGVLSEVAGRLLA